jgi:hypothetical protein
MPPTPPSSIDAEPVRYNHPSAPQIGKWIRHHVLASQNDHGNCYKLVVKHLTVNKKPNGDVGSIKVDKDIASLGGIDHLIDEVCEMAQQDANAMREGIQSYGLYAYFDKDRDYAPRTFFRVSAEEAYDHDAAEGEGSEPATEKGLMAQLMRHNEASARITTIHTSNMIETLMRDNASQRALIEKQMAQAIDFAAIIQESLDNSTARRIAERDAAAKAEIVGSVTEHLKLLLPVIMNKLAGQKIAPETDQSFTLLAGLFESLTSEQQQKLFTEFLTPAQSAVLAEFIETYEKRKKTLTAKGDDNPGPALNLGLMFDRTGDRLRNLDPTKSEDKQLTSMETRAKSFQSVFSRPIPTIGLPLRPADSDPKKP